MVSLVHTSLGSSYLIAHVLHYPPPPRAQLCNRSCSNKHTPVTRSGAGVDLPGVGRRDMSDQDDTSPAPAARGGSSFFSLSISVFVWEAYRDCFLDFLSLYTFFCI